MSLGIVIAGQNLECWYYNILKQRVFYSILTKSSNGQILSNISIFRQFLYGVLPTTARIPQDMEMGRGLICRSVFHSSPLISFAMLQPVLFLYIGILKILFNLLVFCLDLVRIQVYLSHPHYWLNLLGEGHGTCNGADPITWTPVGHGYKYK